MINIIPNKLKEELEDVGRVYNSRSGIRTYPNAFSRLQTKIIKVCNENKELKEKMKSALERIEKLENAFYQNL